MVPIYAKTCQNWIQLNFFFHVIYPKQLSVYPFTVKFWASQFFKTAASVSKISQFRRFFNIISGGFFSIRPNCSAAAAAVRCVCISVSLRVLPCRQWVQSHQSAETGLFVKAEAFWPGNAAFVVMASGLCASEPFRCKVIHWSIAAPQPLLLHTMQCGEIISEGTLLLPGCDGFRIETKS